MVVHYVQSIQLMQTQHVHNLQRYNLYCHICIVNLIIRVILIF